MVIKDGYDLHASLCDMPASFYPRFGSEPNSNSLVRHILQ